MLSGRIHAFFLLSTLHRPVTTEQSREVKGEEEAKEVTDDDKEKNRSCDDRLIKLV